MLFSRRACRVCRTGFAASAMKLGEALDIANRVPAEGAVPKAISLVCGFTPLHLLTYLRAHGRLRFPDAGVSPEIGLFGDLQGNLQRAAQNQRARFVVLEWSDLDPRLGIREGASWNNQTQRDILSEIEHGFDRLWDTLRAACQKSLVVLCRPHFRCRRFPIRRGVQASRFELRLASLLSGLSRESFRRTWPTSAAISVGWTKFQRPARAWTSRWRSLPDSPIAESRGHSRALHHRSGLSGRPKKA